MAKEQYIIEKLIAKTQLLFPSDWLEQYDWTNIPSEELYSLYTIIDEYIQDAFVIFAQSIISGEYVKSQGFSDVLDSLLEVICQENIVYDANQKREAIQNRFSEVCSLLKFNINRYKHFLTKLDNRYEVTSPRYIVNAFSIGEHKGENHVMFGYFDILFDIVKFDHLMSGDKDTIRTLILHHSYIKKNLDEYPYEKDLKQILEILDQKSLFLLKKLLIEDANEFDYLIDFKPHHHSVLSQEVSFFSDFNTSFEFYRSKNYREDSYVRALYQKSLEDNLKIGEMALLMKYYKDYSDTTIFQINKLIDKFEDKYSQLYQQSRSRKYDTYALHTLKNYMYNCRLSFKISSTEYAFDDLEKDMQEIVNIQKATGILNFYPYQKAIEFIASEVAKKKDLSRQTTERYITRLDFYLHKCEDAINWCEERCFMPIQNIYEESIANVEGFGHVLVPSTFCRPINYAKRRHVLSSYKTQALFLRNELSLREEREEIEAIKQQIDKSHWKNIELLSIFTAIITFLFGTVSFMANGANTTITQQIFNIVAIGLVLLLFVSAIAVVTMQREKDHRKYWLHPRVIFLIATIVIFAILLRYILKVAPLLLNISY